MSFLIACVVALLLLTNPSAARAASDATLFRLFLRDGTSLVSYGEFARVDEQVVFSMPVGGPIDEPRLHVVSLPSSEIDWGRTDRYAASARYQRYAETRGEDDFQLLSNNIARVLNEIALSDDKRGALTSAEATVSILLGPLPRSRTYTLDADFNEHLGFGAGVLEIAILGDRSQTTGENDADRDDEQS